MIVHQVVYESGLYAGGTELGPLLPADGWEVTMATILRLSRCPRSIVMV